MDRGLIMALLLCACAPRVPVPELGMQEGAEPMPVPYPPPAARAEVIPPQPDEESVWVDGYWTWKGSDYSWSAGRWVRPGPGMAYAPAEVVRLRDGKLMFYPPRWTRSAEEE